MSAQIRVKGNAGTDPELKFAKNNTAYATFSLADTPRIKKGDDWLDGETVWYRVVTFGEKAESLVDMLSKGDTVIVEGSFKVSSYQDKNGETKSGLEINAREIDVVVRSVKKQKAPEVAPW